MTKHELLLQLEDETFDLLKNRPELSQRMIAQQLGVSLSYVQNVAARRRIKRKPGRRKREN